MFKKLLRTEKKDITNNEAVFLSLSQDISHDLSTSLLGLKHGISGTKKCIKRLVQSYRVASESNLDIPEILPQELNNLKDVLNNCEKETHFLFQYISMLSMNLLALSGKKNSCTNDSASSIKECLKEVFYTYPTKGIDEDNLLKVDFDFFDFKVKGNKEILFSLITNILSIIFEHQKNKNVSDLVINSDTGDMTNILYFIAKDMRLPKGSENVFFEKNSVSTDRIGIAIYSSKKLIEGLGGKISLSTYEMRENDMVFNLEFPALNGEII